MISFFLSYHLTRLGDKTEKYVLYLRIIKFKVIVRHNQQKSVPLFWDPSMHLGGPGPL